MAEPSPKKPRTMESSIPNLTSPSHVRLAAGPSPSKIRVRNLQTTLAGPSDAWGRTARPQPALLSVEVWLRQPFTASSASDQVASDTVHYGLLAKAVMATLKEFEGQEKALTLWECVEGIWRDMVGSGGRGEEGREKKAFLDTSAISYLSVEICLPKASLVGDGVALRWCAAFAEAGAVAAFAPTLSLRGLRMPTLIGVNANERTGKQIVIVGLDIDGKDGPADHYCEIEALVVKIIEQSSYETLEALALDILKQLKAERERRWLSPNPWTMKVALEKPIAVPFADAACVELCMRTDE